MAVDAGHRGVKAGIRDAVDAHSTVVVRHVLDQPIDRVVSIAGLVDLVSSLVRNVRSNILELALAHVTAAHVTISEDVAFARKQLVRAEKSFVVVRPVRSDAVRRAVEHDWIFLFLVLRFVDADKKLHAVAHRNHYFMLGVILFDVVGELALLLIHLSRLRKRRNSKRDYCYSSKQECAESSWFHGISCTEMYFRAANDIKPQ